MLFLELQHVNLQIPLYIYDCWGDDGEMGHGCVGVFALVLATAGHVMTLRLPYSTLDRFIYP